MEKERKKERNCLLLCHSWSISPGCDGDNNFSNFVTMSLWSISKVPTLYQQRTYTLNDVTGFHWGEGVIFLGGSQISKVIVFVSAQEKGAKEQCDKLWSKKAFVRSKEHVLRQNKDCVGGATCWSTNSLYSQCNCTMIFGIEYTSKPWNLVTNL